MSAGVVIAMCALGQLTTSPPQAGMTVAAPQQAMTLFPRLRHDFGHVPRGTRCTVVFPIHNRRGVAVHIAEVRSGCGCVVGTPADMTLQPGQRSQLSVTLATAGYAGEKSDDLMVLLDQPRAEYITLNVKAIIHPEVQVSYGEIDLGRVRRGTDGVNTIQVQFAGATAYRILRVQARSPHVTATFKELYREAQRAGYQIVTRVSGNAPPGLLQDQLQCTIDHPAMPTFTLAVKAQIDQAFQVDPEAVFFGFVPLGKTLERTVRVRGDRPFRVTHFATTTRQVQVRAPGQAAREHTLTVVLQTGKRVGNLRDEVTLHVDVPGQPPMKLTVYAHVREQ